MPRYEGMTGLMLLGLAMMVIGGLVAGLCTLGGVANFAKWGDSSLLAIAITGYIVLFGGMAIVGACRRMACGSTATAFGASRARLKTPM
jgi:hypothetical protein